MDVFGLQAKITLDSSDYEKAIKDSAKAAEESADRTKSLGDSVIELRAEYNLAKTRVDELSKALKEYVAENGDATGGAQELAYMLAEQQQRADDAKSAMKELANSEKEIGSDAGDAEAALGGLADGEKEVGDSAQEAGGKTSVFGDLLKANLTSEIIISGIKQIASTMKELIVETAAYGDNVDKMSQKMGMSASAYQEWDAVMQHCGTSIDSMQASMKTLATAAETGNEAFEKLGMTQEEIANMSQEELFSATIEALQNVSDETERTYLAGKLLGRGATELGALLNTSAEETQAMKDRVHQLGGVMSDEGVKASARFQDSLQDMKTVFRGIGNDIATVALPAVADFMDAVTDAAVAYRNVGIDESISDIGDVSGQLEAAKANVDEWAQKLDFAAQMGENVTYQTQGYANAVEQLNALLADSATQEALLEEIRSGGISVAEVADLLGTSVFEVEQRLTDYGQRAREASTASNELGDALNETDEAAQETAHALREIQDAAANAVHDGGDLRETYNELQSQLESLDGELNEGTLAIVNQKLAALNLAATNQELASTYPAFVGAVGDFDYSLTELSAWLIENGISAEEWGSQVASATDNVINGFQELDTSLDMSLDEMAANLETNINAYADWNSNIATLMAAAVATGDQSKIAFVKHMQEMGIGAAAQVSQMMDDIPGTLDRFGPLMGDAIDQGVFEVYNSIENADIGSAMEGAMQGAVEAVEGVDFSSAGEQKATELANGISDHAEAVATAAQEAANQSLSSFDDVDFTPSGTSAMDEIAAGILENTAPIDAAEEVANLALAAFDAVDGTPSGSSFATELASGISNGADGIRATAEAAAESAANAARVDTSPIGLYFSQGIAQGITAGRSGVISAAISVMQSAVSAAKAAADIHSPSRTMRDEVGKMMTEGIAVGMVSDDALRALDEAADKLTGETVEDLKTMVSAWDKVYDDYRDNLEHQNFLIERNSGDVDAIISNYRTIQETLHEQAEYYRSLGLAENSEYIRDLQEQWWKYEDEIEKAEADRAKSELNLWKNAYSDMMRTGEFSIFMMQRGGASASGIIRATRNLQAGVLQQIQEGYERGLDINDEYIQSLYKQYYSLDDDVESLVKAAGDNVTSVIKNFAAEYETAYSAIQSKQDALMSKMDGTLKLFTLNDSVIGPPAILENLDQQRRAIEEYGNTLEKLRDRGISDSLMQEILDLSVEDATAYGATLLRMRQDRWDQYMGSWEELQDAKTSVAERFYQKEFDALDEEYLSKIPEALEPLRDDMEVLGEGIADALTQGLVGKSPEVQEALLGWFTPIMNIAGTMTQVPGVSSETSYIPSTDTGQTQMETVMETRRYQDESTSLLRQIADSIQNGETQITVNLDGQAVGSIILDYLIQIASANGTPILNGT